MRIRVRKACEPCRHRKVKCDGGYPCDVCAGYDYSCVYADRKVATAAQDLPVGKVSPTAVSQSRESTSMASESPVMETGEPKKLLYVLSDEHQPLRAGNTRFTRADSAIAFPRSLGASLNASSLPRLEAIAWNTGTRTDNLQMNRASIFEYMTLPDVESFSDTYFTSVHPTFNMINREAFEHQVAHCWASQNIDIGFQVVVCGVVALGSLFSSNNLFAYEAEVIEQARLALDSSFAHSKVLVSVDFVVGWILRAIYLRATNGPHVSWMASSMAMHIAESLGLHQEMSEIKTTRAAHGQSHVLSDAEIETRRRTFWVASSLNRLFCAQYGRTMIRPQNLGCRYPTIAPEESADDFVSLIRLLPDLCDATTTWSSNTITVLVDGILQLGNKPVRKLPLVLLRADAVFCIYRKLKWIGVTLSTEHTEVILSVIRSALEAADSLALRFQQWWTIVGVPFHSICVLIALNTMESLSLLYAAIETLQNITAIFNSHRSREALRTAQYLVKGAESRKRKELECLQRCLNLHMMAASTGTQIQSPGGVSELPPFEWPSDVDLGFSYFLDESYTNEDTSMGGGLL